MANPIKILKNGIINENPTFVQVIGMCPTLAVTSSAINGIGMGLSTTAVLIFANLFVSLLRKVIPDKVRIPCFIVVIATFVTIIEFMLKAYLPALNASLGLYIPLIVVNCIIWPEQKHSLPKTAPSLPSSTVSAWVLVSQSLWVFWVWCVNSSAQVLCSISQYCLKHSPELCCSLWLPVRSSHWLA